MKTKFLFPALCALMMCLVACEPTNDPSNSNGGSTGSKETFDKNGAVANGVFSVGEGKQVKFSRGNLQYQASTNTWRFAENQYDYIGEDNKNISATYTGWIDLFGWGTGNNPTNASKNNEDYSTFVDWGTNKITNGGNKANMWRTLSKEEWTYLFEGRAHASHLYGLATIKTLSSKTYGIVIMPDNWVASTLPFYEGMKGWNNNEYTLDEWNELQKLGAVFLPASGYRYGTGVDDVGSGGRYWSSTPYDEDDAYGVYFIDSRLNPQRDLDRSYGRSVRLAQDL